MKLDIFNIQKFIDANKLEEITNTVTFDYNKVPTNDGIMSNTIFGIQGSKDRKTRFAYIDLKKHFFHPVIYKAISAMDRRIVSIIDGSKYYSIKNGDLIEDNENGKTGIKWLYSVWDDLTFKSTGSSRRDDKIDILKNLEKDEIFCSKFLVIPPFFRDINMSKFNDSTVISLDGINSMYIKLLGLCQSSDSEFDFMGYITEMKIQNLLVEIYTFLTGSLASKTGMIKHDLMGKTVDFSTRGVISAPRVKSQTYKSQLIKFGYAGLPISHMCNLFFPFFVYEIRAFLESKISSLNNFYEDETFERTMDDFTPDKIEKLISLYIKSPDSRFTPIVIKTDSGKELNFVFEYETEDRTACKKNLTLLDLMYRIAKKIAEDKHVYVTRYPIETYQNICPFRITVTSTYKTRDIYIEGVLVHDYPLIVTEEEQKSTRFIDTIMMHSSMLEAYGADFDGKAIIQKYK